MSLSINFDLSQAKTSIPIIAEGHQVKVRLANVKARTSENGDSLSFEYNLLEPAPTTEGGRVEPGFPLFENITFYDKNTPKGQIPDRAIKRMSQRIDAFLGTGDAGNKKEKPTRPNLAEGVSSIEQLAAKLGEALIGKEAFAKVKVKTGDYEGNEISSMLNASDLKA